jgi:rhodanese-related sulfurtransferase
MKFLVTTFLMFLLAVSTSFADEKKMKYLGLFDKKTKSYIIGSGEDAIEIKRVMTACGKNPGYFQPFVPVKGVTPVTEADMLRALNDKEAIVVDMRVSEQYLKETIPTAINIPFSEMELRLDELGCVKKGQNWECSKAKKVYGFCNGPVCAQSPIAMKAMVRNGFPAEKIYYYRGGMLDWDAVGLTTVEGEF